MRCPAVSIRRFPSGAPISASTPRRHADWRVRGYLMQDRPNAFKPRAAARRPARVQPRLYARRRVVAVRSGQRLLSPASAAARRDARLHVRAGRRHWSALVRRGDRRAAGHASPGRRPADAQLLSARRATKCRSGAASKSCRPPCAAGRCDDARRDLRLRQPRPHVQNEPYGWCWAAAAFLDRHPRYQPRFRQLARRGRRAPISRAALAQSLRRRLAAAGRRLAGVRRPTSTTATTFARDASRFRAGEAAGRRPARRSASRPIAAGNRAACGCEAGQNIGSRASGRYQVADEPRIWWCEPGGVTIRYYHGQPLGILLAAVLATRRQRCRSERPAQAAASVWARYSTLDAARSARSTCRINDSAGQPGRQRRLARRDDRHAQ